LAFEAKITRSSSPAKAGDPVSPGLSIRLRDHRVLDAPPARGMTEWLTLRGQDKGQRHCSTICRKGLAASSIV
jgi:hypothetical protein